MSVFGTGYPLLSGSLGIVQLEHSILNYDFFGVDVVEHTSVITGHKTYPYNRNKSTFEVDVLLCNYTGSGESSSLAKFNDILKYKDRYFNFYPHNDWSASVDVYNAPIEMYMTEFVPYYLNDDNRYDGVVLKIEPRKNSVLKIKQPTGYGTSYGLDWGYTGF